MNNTPPVSEDKQFSELNQVQKNWKIQKKQKIENEKKIIKQTKNIVYIIRHGLMLPSMVEIPGGRIIYPKWYRCKRGSRPDTVMTDSLHS